MEIVNEDLNIASSDVYECEDFATLKAWEKAQGEQVAILTAEVKRDIHRGGKIYGNLVKKESLQKELLKIIRRRIIEIKSKPKQTDGKKIQELQHVISEKTLTIRRYQAESQFWRNQLTNYCDVSVFYDEVNRLKMAINN